MQARDSKGRFLPRANTQAAIAKMAETTTGAKSTWDAKSFMAGAAFAVLVFIVAAIILS